jgi:hypothetical protein
MITRSTHVPFNISQLNYDFKNYISNSVNNKIFSLISTFLSQVKVYENIQEELKVKTDALKKSKLKVRLMQVFVTRDQCYKNTMVNYCGNFNHTFLGLK